MFARARIRLALFYAGAMATIFVATGATAYLFLRDQLDDEINTSLDRSLDSLRDFAPPVLVGGPGTFGTPQGQGPAGGPGTRREEDDHRPRDPLSGLSSDVFYVVTNAGGEAIANPRNVELTNFPLERISTQPNETSGREEFDGGGHHYRVVSRVQPLAAQPSGRLIIGRSLDARDHQLRALAIVLGAGGAAGVLLAALGGFWIAGRTLQPIRVTLETQRRFVSDASHELRTPVAVMKANAELMLRHPDETVEANIDQVAAINDEADHMGKLVGDLLTLARADEQQLQLERQRVDLDDLLEGLVRDMRPLAESKALAMTTDLHAGPLDGDAQRLRQLATILLDNALKYTPPRGSVKVSAWREGGRLGFSVADTGPGISADEQQRIFDRFYRGDKARSHGGTGLGLAIAQWIASAHGGRLTVESQPGAGATFTVRLPARK